MSREVTNRQLVMILVIMLATTADLSFENNGGATEGGFWFAILVTGVIFHFWRSSSPFSNEKPRQNAFDHAKDAFGPFWANVIALIILFLLALILSLPISSAWSAPTCS